MISLLVLALLMLVSPPGSAVFTEREVAFGRSVEERELSASRIGPGNADRTVLVIGSIHGDETEGHEIVERLRDQRVEDVAVWTVKTVNPDGVVAETRGNARGVDLNRNFALDWQPSADTSSGYYPGPRPRSEPETRAVERLTKKLRPDVVIAYHQPWDQVLGPCNGPDRLQRRYAALTDSEFACRGSDLPGTATKWLRRTGARAFVVELGAGELAPKDAARHARSIVRIAESG